MSTLSPIHIQSAPKASANGAHRTITSEETWRRLEPLIPRIGITRLADITGLDRINIPTYSAVRPTHKRTVSVTCGKGLSPIDAKVGAVMESIEYKLSEPDARGTVCTMAELPGPVIHPSDLHLPPWTKNVETLSLDWVEGWDLVQGEAVWLPAAAAFLMDPRGDFLFDPDTNGVASGNCLEEAIFHALVEVIERDAESISKSFLAIREDDERYALVRHDSLPDSSRALVERFEQNGIDIYIEDITSDLEVPSFSVTSVDRQTDKLLVHGGSGSHLVAEIALNRALTEAAQSRAADIQGSREDLTFFRRQDRDPRNHREWTAPPLRSVPFSAVSHASVRNQDIADDIMLLLQRLQQHRFNRVVVVDLTDPNLGIPTVRVVVPGLEINVVDPWRTGPRLAPEYRLAAQEHRIV